MASEASLSLPTIDLSKVDLESSGSPEWESLKSQVWKAAEEYGCFKVLFNKVSNDLKTSTYDSIQELYDLPLEAKKRNFSDKLYHGYSGQSPFVPLYEAISFDEATILDSVESSTNVLWPEGNSNFSQTMNSYAKKVSELDLIIRRMIVESLGLEKYWDEHMNSSYYLLRVMKYEAPKTLEEEIGLVPHIDPNILTILSQNHVDGLEIKTEEGEYVDVKLSSESFIVFIGESLTAWTNGRLQPARHRVMMRGTETRYTAALFANLKGGITIKTPEEMVDEKHPLLYKPFDYSGFLDFFSARYTKGHEFPLKAYCGV